MNLIISIGMWSNGFKDIETLPIVVLVSSLGGLALCESIERTRG